MENIIKQYTNAKTPYFFRYAKDKVYSGNVGDSQVEPINLSMMNRITREIKENRNMFASIKSMGDLDYTMLLPNRSDQYVNEDLNKRFDRWNKKYSNVLNTDEDIWRKNNLPTIIRTVYEDLVGVEPDVTKIINSLVVFMYKKPGARRKNLLWHVFGEQLYNNLWENLKGYPTNICQCCGKRTDEHLIRGKCFKCRQTEVKELQGMKLVKCIDCGEELLMPIRSRTCRCEDCKRKRKNDRNKNNMRKYRLTNQN